MPENAGLFHRIRPHAEWEAVKWLVSLGGPVLIATAYSLYQRVHHLSIDWCILMGTFLLSLGCIIAAFWLSARQFSLADKGKSSLPVPVPPTIPSLSESEIQGMISMWPHQNTATVWLNQAGSLRFDGCMVIHNCSQEQMTALSLQNLRITLGQNTVLLSDHTINIRVEVGPRVFYEHLFSIDLHERQAEKILEKFHGVDYREFLEIGVSGKLVFSYAGKEHTKPISMVFNTEARR
jgi:hypothetical protein